MRRGELDVGEALVVAQLDVVARTVALDEVRLEQQRLGRRGRHRHLDPRHEPQHDQRLAGMRAAVEVALDPVPELPRFADVKHFAVRIEHAVHAGLCGQPGKKARDVERGLRHGEIFSRRSPGARELPRFQAFVATLKRVSSQQ